jgi:hypothetical protein
LLESAVNFDNDKMENEIMSEGRITTLFACAGAAICGTAAAVGTVAMGPLEDLAAVSSITAALGLMMGAGFGLDPVMWEGPGRGEHIRNFGKMCGLGMLVGATGLPGMFGALAGAAGFGVGATIGAAVEGARDFVRNRGSVPPAPSNG